MPSNIGAGLQGSRGTRSVAGIVSVAALVATMLPLPGRAAVEYPGARPGRAAAARSRTTVLLANQAISASWSFAPQGLRLVSVRDIRKQLSLEFSGEAFQIILEDGTRYPASAMLADGEPSVGELVPEPEASGLSGRIPGQKLEIHFHSADGRLRVVWRALMQDEANYVREEIDLVATGRNENVKEIVWLSEIVPDAHTAGKVDGSPIVAGSFFFGYEDPMAVNSVAPVDKRPGKRVVCRLQRNAVLKPGQVLTQSFVAGVAPADQMRRAFLYYLERERAHPYRTFLHYNSWYDIAWDPFALDEANCLDAIRTFGNHFIKPYGVVVDSMVFDDGWDDPETLWHFHKGFSKGFAPLAELCRRYNTHLGVWLSPFGGYGESKQQRLNFGRGQGYEINDQGFSLAGPKYYAEFKNACVSMIREYGVNYFKFDGIASGMYADGSGADYILDTEAMRRLMLELRKEDPNLYINLTTGSWPSPFWLRYADSLWRQGEDMGFAGEGGRQQQWITYRDQETYKNVVVKGPLFPLNSLMTQGVAYSRHGSAGSPEFNSSGFKDDVRAFFGCGTGLQELYIQPGRLTPQDWQVLAEAAKWSRANAGVLVDTHWIGGDPARGEVYGYASWTPRKGIIMLRNPEGEPQEFALEAGAAFELPAGAPGRFTLASPWAEDEQKPQFTAEAGRPLRLKLKPFEVIVLEAVNIP
jgi:hypothetical protein